MSKELGDNSNIQAQAGEARRRREEGRYKTTFWIWNVSNLRGSGSLAESQRTSYAISLTKTEEQAS